MKRFAKYNDRQNYLLYSIKVTILIDHSNIVYTIYTQASLAVSITKLYRNSISIVSHVQAT